MTGQPKYFRSIIKDNFLFDTIIDWAVQFCTQISLPIILTDLIDEFMFW